MTKNISQEVEVTEDIMIQKINFDGIPFSLTYEEFLAVKVPLYKNFTMKEKDMQDANYSDIGNDFVITEELTLRKNSKRQCIIGIALMLLAALVVIAIYFVVSMN
jgi:hypothetical protein